MSINIDNLDSNLIRSEDLLSSEESVSDNLQELSTEELKISGGTEDSSISNEDSSISIAIGGEKFTIDGDGINVIVPEAVANSNRFMTQGDDIDVFTYKSGPRPIYGGSISINIVESSSSSSSSHS